MDDINWAGLWAAAFLFAGGVLARPLGELANYPVKRLVDRRERNELAAQGISTQASEKALAALTTLVDVIPSAGFMKRGMYPLGLERQDLPTVMGQIDAALAQLEANTFLLPQAVATKLGDVHEILEAASTICRESSEPATHYDHEIVIVRGCVSYGRSILAAHLRGESPPPQPQRIHEYLLAIKDREDFWSNEIYADEEQLRAGEIRQWQERHGLPASPTIT